MIHSTRSIRLRRPLAAAILCALCMPGLAAESDAPICPIGIHACPRPSADWSQCPPNDLLEFHVPGLPTSGERTAADTEVEARYGSSADGDTYVLEGDASIRQLDQLIRADRFTYTQSSTAWSAEGAVRYQDRNLLMSAKSGRGTTAPASGSLDGVRYQLLSSRGNGRAGAAVLKDTDHAELTDTSFSTCPLDSPGWEFRAREMQLDQAEGVGVARDLSFRIADVPVFWLPYATFPLDDRRKSGFLFPEFGYNDRRGFDFSLPYYLNLAPNYDLTLTPRLMSHRGLMLGGEFRYLTDSSRGSVELNLLPDDRKDDGSRRLFHWDNRSRFSRHWGAEIDINRASDDRWFEDFGRSLNIAATSLLPSRAYVVGNGTWWNARIGGDEYQITDPTLPGAAEPYRRLPRVTFDAERNLFGGIDGGIRSEFVAFSNDDAVDGRRLDLHPYLAYPIDAAAYFMRPEIGYRYTRYDIDRDGNRHPDRGMPIASLDAGLRFERALNLAGGDWTQTLEPRLYYLHVPYRDQDDLPLFDTQETPFSFGQLFRTNRFVGADRQMDANNLTLALTSRLLDGDGTERLSASIGQIRHFDDQRVQLPGRPATDFSGSAYIGELDLRISDRWRATLANQWNPNSDRTDLSSIGIQNRFGREGVANLSYRFRRDFLEYVDGSVLVPISGAWRFVARWNYSLRDNTTLEAFAGIEHDSCCTAWRVLGRRYVHNIEGDATNALYFEVEFKGIGSIGQKTGDFLRRAILGYQ
ncbi:MAG TPA: LPS assembly protein LptD [Dokdonella sp.]|uniref:LPS-assembly protein LptD n=1 Tax=Dokdonella sp. TaxID=2291710 RepID=UPI0025C6E0C9|nr:LPS assembly protein LptD [Dokdonella sp.]MBX3691869.1 LPS assembly protein LptD [Dokdonella sp.]MCW5569004.1 LPS assembly protein LptD [Dokdonella sp.]HNR92135.1 LPS assembly protein LptD [Dokdonella sp.]